MESYKYKFTNENGLPQQLVIMTPVDDSGRYLILFNEGNLGYLFVDGVDSRTGKKIWKGSNTMLNIIAPQAGEYIEHSCNPKKKTS